MNNYKKIKVEFALSISRYFEQLGEKIVPS